MKRANASPPPAVAVRPHPPERGLVRAMARGEVLASDACCSCCCCCLHSVGGLAGAIAGTFYPTAPRASRLKQAPPAGLRDDELGGRTPAVPAGSGSMVKAIYWLSTAALTILAIVVLAMSDAAGLGAGSFMVILGLPLVLLGGSAVSAVAIACRPSLRGDAEAWKRLGRIALGIVVGTMIGGLSMMFLFR